MIKKHNLTLKKLATIFVVLITILSMVVVPSAQACTRFVYQKTSETSPITARSMDWMEFPDTKLWFFPKGLDRKGGAGNNSVQWISQYASIVNSSYDLTMVDGINEKGLVANLLFLGDTEYGTNQDQDEKDISLGAWGQYVLDNYQDVNEAVACLTKNMSSDHYQIISPDDQDNDQGQIVCDNQANKPLHIVTITLGADGLQGQKLALHMSLSDKDGDSAILEYIDGKLIIHQDSKYDVLTNDPIYSEQLAINSYWDTLYKSSVQDSSPEATLFPNAGVFLPGTSNTSDRFVRANYYLHKMEMENSLKSNPKNFDPDSERNGELAGAFGIIRNVSDPIGLAIPGNLGTTQWRTVASQDPENLLYFFEKTNSPNIVWVSMKTMLSELSSQEVKFLDMGSLTEINNDLVGDVSSKFELGDKNGLNWNLCDRSEEGFDFEAPPECKKIPQD
ncbi:linear amide C-N hydrolase [Okeania sp. SIO2B9]|uniref:linear amide C-N hydrolase n=1 Tax=Okeania sp. SIO2B9 TaxID=2607782 RepID=UPI001429DFEE|nr:linear amide C-N hydrolase [Okeania sp. SIO2B9]NES90758.1 linear amide C-N hydrolase [Okeania sp. SIO2B9]